MVSQPEYEDLGIAIKHNQFGGFCLQAEDLDKAHTHFTKALETIRDKYLIPVSNIEMNLGNLYGQKRNYEESIKHYLKAIEISPHNIANKNTPLP